MAETDKLNGGEDPKVDFVNTGPEPPLYKKLKDVSTFFWLH